jgi:beta-glucosidase
MRNHYLLTLLSLTLLFSACAKKNGVALGNDDVKIETPKVATTPKTKVDLLMEKMTLEEKIGQMTQYNGFWDVTGPPPTAGTGADKYADLKAGRVGSMLNIKGVKDVKALQKVVVENTRLGIPLIFGYDIIHGYKTLSPIPLAEAASWDLEAIKNSAATAATEAAAAGINWTFAPMMDVSHDARWGRVMEGSGEDPFLQSKIAVARVKGFQGNDLSAVNTIAACAKHYAAYGFAEAGRDYNTVDISGSTLHNMILPPFKAVAAAGVATFMNSFNEINGVPANANNYLLKDLLKNKWNYKGFVVSDWGSIAEIVVHGKATDLRHAAELSAKAGCDMDMEANAYILHLKNLVEAGKVPSSIIDDAARRVLQVKSDLGLLDDPYKYCDENREKTTVYSQTLRNNVRDIAKKSIVLLKNQGNLLPLRKQGQKIAIIGALATEKNSPLGSWRIASDDNTAVSVVEGMQKYAGNTYTVSKGVELLAAPASFQNEVKINVTDRTGINEAKAVAANADVVVLVVGEHGFQSGEGRSRSSIDIPGLQQELLEAVYASNKNVVMVLMNGRPLAIEWADKNIPTIVEAWHLGTESGNAIAEVLYGDYVPSGKLPMSFPKNVGQVPIYYNHKNTGRPNKYDFNDQMVFWSHYGDVSNEPLYHFGHGLSYTTFTYSDLVITPESKGATVSVKVSNTGSYDAEEVVQLYIQDKVGSLTRPVQELKGFEKVMIKKGDSTTVTFKLTEAELGFYDNDGNYLVEPGEFDIMVGGSSKNTLKGNYTLVTW